MTGLPALCCDPQDEGRRGGCGRTGPTEPGGREPSGLGRLPRVRAQRLLGPHGGQSAFAASAQLAPSLPQPGQAQSLQPHVCPALGLRHGEGREEVYRVAVRHMGGTGLWGRRSKRVPKGRQGRKGKDRFLRGKGTNKVPKDYTSASARLCKTGL